jgi:hypothetical protein
VAVAGKNHLLATLQASIGVKNSWGALFLAKGVNASISGASTERVEGTVNRVQLQGLDHVRNKKRSGADTPGVLGFS